MAYAARIYVNENGTVMGAADTDQAGSRTVDGRTAGGRPVEFAGQWFGSQMDYAPFKRAVAEAATRAATRESAVVKLGALAS